MRYKYRLLIEGCGSLQRRWEECKPIQHSACTRVRHCAVTVVTLQLCGEWTFTEVKCTVYLCDTDSIVALFYSTALLISFLEKNIFQQRNGMHLLGKGRSAVYPLKESRQLK